MGLWDRILYWVQVEAKKKGAMVKSRTGLVRNSGFPSGRAVHDWSYRMEGAVSMREGKGGLSCVLEVRAATEGWSLGHRNPFSPTVSQEAALGTRHTQRTSARGKRGTGTQLSPSPPPILPAPVHTSGVVLAL